MNELNNLVKTYADLLVKVGLNLQAGQRLVVISQVDAADFVRQVAASAYQAGARFVNVIYRDDQVTLARYRFAPRDSFEEFPTWFSTTLEEYAKNGDALLRIYADDPDVLKGQDPELIAIAQKAAAHHMRPFSQLQSSDALNWVVAGVPQAAWAQRVFPEASQEGAIERLWEAILQVCRINEPDPIAAWQSHIQDLMARRKMMNDKQYRQLVFRAPGTELHVGLPENHIWHGGQGRTQSGIPYTPNLPTEEIFTLPHRLQVNGTVRATRPLSLRGTLVEDFSLTFKDGRLVDVQARSGLATLQKTIETDPGAAFLGEVALVPHNSPIAQSGIIFFNTLYDENAACHLALGRAYRFCLQDGAKYTSEEFCNLGGNDSLIHEDFMIGSGQIDVDGITPEGRTEALLQSGEWAFEV